MTTQPLKLYTDWIIPADEIATDLLELDSKFFQATVYYIDPSTKQRVDVDGVKSFSPSEGTIPAAGDVEVTLTFTTSDTPPSGYYFLLPPENNVRTIHVLELSTRVEGDDWIHWPVPLFESKKPTDGESDIPIQLFSQPHWRNRDPKPMEAGQLPYGYTFGPEWKEAVVFFEDRLTPKKEGGATPYVRPPEEGASPNIISGEIEYEGFDLDEKLDVGTHTIKAIWRLDDEPYKEYGLFLGGIELERQYEIEIVQQEPVIIWDTVEKSESAIKNGILVEAPCEISSKKIPYITNSNAEYPIKAVDPITQEEIEGDFEFDPPEGTPVYESFELKAKFIPTDVNYYEIDLPPVTIHVSSRDKGEQNPPVMFNALVASVDSSVGFGGDNSSCSFTLVEDPENGYNINIPPAGTACYFRYRGFKFSGVLQRWNYSESIGGKKYNVLLNSVSSFMDGVHVILDKFEGTAFLGDTKFSPSGGQQIPYQNGGVRNLLNPYGYFENFTLGLGGGATDGICGGQELDQFAGGDDGQWTFNPDLVDEFGIGTWGDSGRNDQGFNGRKLLSTIQAISQGGTPHGDKLFFGKTQYKLDLSELIPLVPEYYRISASPSLDLNSIITDMCELIQHDYIWTLDGEENTECPDFGDQYLDQDNVIAKIKLIDKGKPPSAGIIKEFVESARDSGTLINSSIGKEFQNEATQKVILGGQATRYFLATQADMIPVFGQTSDGGYIVSRNFENVQSGAYNDDRKITLFVQGSKYSTAFTGGGPRSYNCSIAELRAARKGMDSWLTFKWLEHIWLLLNGGSDYTSGLFENYSADLDFCGLTSFGAPSRLQGLGPLASTQVMKNSMMNFNGGPVTFSSAELNILANRFAGYLELDETGTYSGIWSTVSNCAENFFGRRFLIFLPKEPGGIENNLKILKDNVDQIPSWELADSAWVDESPPYLDNPRYYDESGMLKPINVFPSNCSLGGGVAERFSAGEITGIATNENGPSFPAGIEWLQLGSLECELEPYVVVDTGVQAESSDLFTSNNWGFLMMSMFISQGTSHPWGKGVGGSGPTSVAFGPSVKAPVAIGIPQKSQRYSWGPWYHANHKNGKLDFIYDPELVPQSFGSQQAMSEMAQSQANTGVATMEEAENGSYEIAEYPQYNLADRLLGAGPYVTNISIKVGTSGISTSYRFNTWTPDFGKLQKYNQNRMSRIWRNKMNSLKGDGSSGSGMGSYRTAREEIQSKDYPKVANTFNPETSAIMGSSGWGEGLLSTGHHEITSSSASTLYSSTAADAGVGPNYKTSFGNSKEQFYAGYSSNRDRIPNQSLPSIQDPSMGGEMVTGENLASAGFNVYRAGSSDGAILPTSNDLDPYMNYGIFGNNTGGGVVGNTQQQQNPVEQWIDDCVHKDYLFFVYDIQNSFPNTISPYKAKLNESFSGQALKDMTEARAAGLKGPLVLSGWGFDIANNPVPSDTDNIRNFNTQLLCNRKNWKTGPVKLMWDEERKIWSGGLETLTGVVYEDDVEAPQSPTQPTTFKLKVLRKVDAAKGTESSLDYADPPEVITCYNRDPNFSMSAGPNSYLTVMRINYEWVPLAGGATVGDIVSFETQEPEEECKQDTHIWWVSVQREGNANRPGITDPTEFPSGGPGNFDWNGFEPKKPERHADYCQNSGTQGFDGKNAWRANTEIIYEGESLDNVATTPGEGLNNHFWIMKTCYPSPGNAEATLEVCAGSELQTGHYFGIRDSYSNIDGVNPLINETDETFARYFYFVVDGDETGVPQFSDYPTSADFAGTPEEFMELHVKAIHINSDDPPSIVAQKIHYALYGSDIPFTSSADCGKVKITQSLSGLTGDQSNEGLSSLPSCMKLSNFAGGEGFDPEAWGAANSGNLVEWINYESDALTDGTFFPENDSWFGSDGDWAGPNYGDATIGSIYHNGWNGTYQTPNSLRLDDWEDMVEMLHDMSSYLGNHDYTTNEIINKITGEDPLTGKPWLSECDEDNRKCEGRQDFSSIIGRITQYPCNVTEVPGEICVKENDEGQWEVDSESADSDDCRGYIQIQDPMGAFLNNRFAKDLRGRRGVAMYVWNYQPNGPCGDDPNYYDSHSNPNCYWMIIWMDMFEEIDLVSDVIIGTKSITIEKKKVDVWNYCDLDPHRIEGATCEYEEDGTDPGGSPAA